MNKYASFNIEDRLINFSVLIIKLAEALPNSKTGNHIRSQMIRSGTSPAANYGEAQGAESRADFIHKLKISLKELRETRVWLLIIKRAELIHSLTKIDSILDENDQLISILFSSIQTANKNAKKH